MRTMALALILTLIALPAAAISGDYLEARTSDVYTGPCFANGEVNLAGREAVVAWRVREGSWQGVAVDGRLYLADDDPTRPLRQERVGGRTLHVNSDGRRLEIGLPSAADSPVDEIRRWAEAAVNKKIGADGLTTPLSLAEW